MKRIILPLIFLITLLLAGLPLSLCAHENNFELHPLAGEYTVDVETTDLGSNSWVFKYSITNNTQEGDWITPPLTGLPEWMNGIDFTGVSNFFVKIPHGAIVSNVQLPASYGASHGVNPDYVHQWEMQGPWQENPGDLHDWIMIYPYGFAEIYPKGTTLTFSFQIDGVAVGTDQGQISTYYPDHQARYPSQENYEKWYDCYSFEMTNPVALSTEPQPPTNPVEVGGDIFPVNKFVILAPAIILVVALLSGLVILKRKNIRVR